MIQFERLQNKVKMLIRVQSLPTVYKLGLREEMSFTRYGDLTVPLITGSLTYSSIDGTYIYTGPPPPPTPRARAKQTNKQNTHTVGVFFSSELP